MRRVRTDGDFDRHGDPVCGGHLTGQGGPRRHVRGAVRLLERFYLLLLLQECEFAGTVVVLEGHEPFDLGNVVLEHHCEIQVEPGVVEVHGEPDRFAAQTRQIVLRRGARDEPDHEIGLPRSGARPMSSRSRLPTFAATVATMWASASAKSTSSPLA